MKNQIINTLLAVIFTSFAAFASSSEPSISTDGTKSFIIDNKIWKSETVNVNIEDENGIVIFSEEQDLSTSKRFNLTKLESGNYTVTISNDLKIVKNNITITEKKMMIGLDAHTSYKPVFQISNDAIDINFLAENAKTKIYIQDTENTLYSSSTSDEMSINKRYNISALPSGIYSIVVSTTNGIFTKEFKK